jgi:transposase-like protein
MNWIKERAKAFVGALAASMTVAVIHAVEQTFPVLVIDDVTEATIASMVAGAVVGWLVYRVPNKPLEPKP